MAPPLSQRKMLTVKQICRAFSVTRMTIYNWRKFENMPAIVIGDGARPTVLFNRIAVIRWAKSRGKLYTYPLK